MPLPETSIETHRPSLEGLAYRMLGSWADAQDIAQEAILKWYSLSEAEQNTVRKPLAWLHKVTSRLSIDRLKSAQRQRETYVGTWLPEPMLTSDTSPADIACIDDSITLALLHAMERLTPGERAAFILHDVFDYPFAEVSSILEKSEAACRQLANRARASLRDEKRKKEVAPESHAKILRAFLQAANEGDAAMLEASLAEDAILYSDGGAKARAARRPLYSREILSRFFMGLYRKALKLGLEQEVRFMTLNALPTALIYVDGKLTTVLSITIQGEKIQTLFQQRNPDKLRHLQTVFKN